MTKETRMLVENACYHIYARGNQKQRVFIDARDYKEYLGRLHRYKRRYKFLLYGFCLMPNHIHLVGEPTQPENLSKFMQGLTLSYTAYFNKRHKKVGHLWQSRFKSKLIVKDQYLISCVHYVEQNPVRANLVTSAQEYPWGSHKERVFSQDTKTRFLDPLEI
jgi:putative transposase